MPWGQGFSPDSCTQVLLDISMNFDQILLFGIVKIYVYYQLARVGSGNLWQCRAK